MKELQQLLDHLHKFKGIKKCHIETGFQGVCASEYPSVHIFYGGSTWSGSALSIDASMATSVEEKQFAFLLARHIATGWRSIVVAMKNSSVVFFNGKMVGRQT